MKSGRGVILCWSDVLPQGCHGIRQIVMVGGAIRFPGQ